jgi:hypothetical protein
LLPEAVGSTLADVIQPTHLNETFMTASATKITLASRVRPSASALIQPTGDEAIVLDITGERYYGLNEVGARLWALLISNPLLEDAHHRLLDEYTVTASDLERDLITIVDHLAEAGLVSVD